MDCSESVEKHHRRMWYLQAPQGADGKQKAALEAGQADVPTRNLASTAIPADEAKISGPSAAQAAAKVEACSTATALAIFDGPQAPHSTSELGSLFGAAGCSTHPTLSLAEAATAAAVASAAEGPSTEAAKAHNASPIVQKNGTQVYSEEGAAGIVHTDRAKEGEREVLVEQAAESGTHVSVADDAADPKGALSLGADVEVEGGDSMAGAASTLGSTPAEGPIAAAQTDTVSNALDKPEQQGPEAETATVAVSGAGITTAAAPEAIQPEEKASEVPYTGRTAESDGQPASDPSATAVLQQVVTKKAVVPTTFALVPQGPGFAKPAGEGIRGRAPKTVEANVGASTASPEPDADAEPSSPDEWELTDVPQSWLPVPLVEVCVMLQRLAVVLPCFLATRCEN
jgi:hypothetical protein